MFLRTNNPLRHEEVSQQRGVDEGLNDAVHETGVTQVDKTTKAERRPWPDAKSVGGSPAEEKFGER